MFDISQISQVAACNDGQDLDLFFKGEHVVTVTVLGSHSDKVRAFTDAKLIEFARGQAFAKNKGTEAEINQAIKMLNERDARSVESAKIRTTNWRITDNVKADKGFTFTDELVTQWLTNNPTWRDQIIEFSEELGKQNLRRMRICSHTPSMNLISTSKAKTENQHGIIWILFQSEQARHIQI